jgi:predicted acetyltransferase
LTEEIRLARLRRSDKAVLARLLQLYLYEMTTHVPFPIGQDGLFPYPFLDAYWDEDGEPSAGRHAYLIVAGGELAGFALVMDWCPITGEKPCHFVSEFFVLAARRRQGVATTVCRLLLDQHPGKWHIGVIERNAPAVAFWRTVAQFRQAAESRHQHDGEDWRLYAFTA